MKTDIYFALSSWKRLSDVCFFNDIFPSLTWDDVKFRKTFSYFLILTGILLPVGMKRCEAAT